MVRGVKFCMLSLYFAIGIDVAISATADQSSKTKKQNEQQQIKTNSAEAQRTHIETLRSFVEKCQDKAKIYQAMQQVTAMRRDSAFDLAVVSGKPAEKVADPELVHVACASDAKAVMATPSRDFVKSFRIEAQRERAADLVAQWLTVMNGIGSKANGDERSKFETIANRISLDL